MNKEFEQQHLQEFPKESRQEKTARFICLEYCINLENFDKLVCTGVDRDGDAMPITGEEHSKIRSNEREQRDTLNAQAAYHSISHAMLKDMLKEVSGYKHEKLIHLRDNHLNEQLWGNACQEDKEGLDMDEIEKCLNDMEEDDNAQQ